MNLWTEIRTVMIVGRKGTVRAASEAMGVHRATTTRHIDTVERYLRTKLFIRHKNGYTPTEVGKELIKLAESADATFNDFSEKLSRSSSEISGFVTVSAVPNVGPIIKSATNLFCHKHAKAHVKLKVSTEMPALELGEADLAIHTGRQPTHPDYIPIAFFELSMGLYGNRSYLREYGFPVTAEELAKHRYIGSLSFKGEPDWLAYYGNFPMPENLVLETKDPSATLDGVKAGLGLGFIDEHEAERDEDLIEVLPQDTQMTADVWITTHIDVRRSPLVSSFIECLKHVRP